MSEKMDKSQTGFVPKLGTQVILLQVVRRMKREERILRRTHYLLTSAAPTIQSIEKKYMT